MTDRRTWSVRGGDRFGIFGERVVVVLPPSQKARAVAVWQLVDDGAGFEETLDALLGPGLRGLPDLVLVGRDDEDARVLVRGSARVEVTADGRAETVASEPGTTWVERRITDITRVRIEAADPGAGDADDTDEGDELVVDGGLVRLSSAEWARDAGQTDQPTPEPAAEPAPQPAAESAPDESELTEAIAVPWPPAPAWSDPDHDGATHAGTGPSPFARQPPGIPGQPPAPPVTRPVARLAFSTGETVDVDRAVLVGRAPAPGRLGPEEEPRLVPVHSPHQEISSTHLEVRPGSGADHGSAVVTDLGSTNGTVLVQPGLPPEDLKAGVGVQLVPGAVIDLGDGVTIRVTHP